MANTVAGLWTVILAAGGSTRFGSPKQLSRLRGELQIRRAAKLALTVTPSHLVTVVGAARLRARNALRSVSADIHVIDNAQWRAGMSGSLRRGLRALPRSASAALLLAVDQPLLTEPDLRRLISAWCRHPQRPAAAAYAGRVGIPAILPRRYWLRAARAEGDIGAREVLRDPRVAVTAVALPEAAVDVDTREDLDEAARHTRVRVNPFRRASRFGR